MRFLPTELPGLTVIEAEKIEDERGYFARTSCETEFAAHGLNVMWPQSSISFNRRAGTLRGMHFQRAPHAEIKLVRCTRGAIFDVALDLRPDSPTYRRWHGAVLSADNARMFYIPEGFAHGFVTLEDATEVLYQISAPYHAASAAGVRWNDPAFAIAWPREPAVISARDAHYPDHAVGVP